MRNTETDKYRFDNAYETVYELYDLSDNAYVFFCTYLAAGILKSDDYNTAEQKIEELKNNC